MSQEQGGPPPTNPVPWGSPPPPPPAGAPPAPAGQVPVPVPPAGQVPAPGPTRRQVLPRRLSGIWIGVILSSLVLIFLLIFILQNGASVEINFLGASGTLPVGVALLLAAICGVLVIAIPAATGSLQRRRAARRQAREDV